LQQQYRRGDAVRGAGGGGVEARSRPGIRSGPPDRVVPRRRIAVRAIRSLADCRRGLRPRVLPEINETCAVIDRAYSYSDSLNARSSAVYPFPPIATTMYCFPFSI